MAGVLVDTTIWIDLSRGVRAAAGFLFLSRGKGRVACSVMTVMETLIGADDARHAHALESIFKTYEVLPVTEEDGWQAARIVRAHARSSSIGVVDAMLAAAALREGLVLATHNLKDFRGIAGLKVEKPY